ncbi:hypothetical protein L6164_025332 [Bauhinia variegata]|uniref:Uncharacterized protein n=1 Tax=Bauhinia variegata TaxID=167791 RepID=A0ACB9M3E3_BAUVA|nr:hypothetical protein L6164_025332 [Bauhinia variegata]
MLNRLSRRCFCTAAPRPWLFVGLGNPGDKYKGTRHNVHSTLYYNMVHPENSVFDFFNGSKTGPLASYYKLPLNRALVFHDDMNLPCGVLRLHHKGGQGSHNGYTK